MQTYGFDIAAMALNQPRDKIQIDLQGWSVKTAWLALYANWSTTVGATALDKHPIYSTCLLEEINCEQDEEMGELCLVVLTYGQRYSNTPTTPLPPPQYGINGAGEEIDIRRHPTFVQADDSGNGPWSQWWNPETKAFDPNYLPPGVTGPPPPMPAYLIGVTKYVTGGAVVWTKIYFESQPTDPLPDGTIQDPGFGYGPSGCYLVVTCDDQKENAFWCRTTHYKFSTTPWPIEIYNNPNVVVPGTLNTDGSISS